MDGWINLHRKLIDHWVWENEKYLKAWIWFLLRANHDTKRIPFGGKKINLKGGEFITSTAKISEETGLSKQGVRTFLKRLTDDEMINTRSNTRSTHVSICNYDTYQTAQHTTNKPANNRQENKKENRPSVEEVAAYCLSRKNGIDAEKFVAHYDAIGWVYGKDKKPIKSWKGAVITWEKNNEERNKPKERGMVY